MRSSKMRTEANTIRSQTQINDIDANLNKLVTLSKREGSLSVENVINALNQDRLVLVQGLPAEGADVVMAAVADALKLRDQLEVQAGFASIQGHRENIGRYYMSVNKRDNYEFIPPHSEGTSSINMQLASFYCYENSTDGGESVFFNVNSDSSLWAQQRELIVKARITQSSLSAAEIAQAKLMFQLDLEKDLVQEEDQILQKLDTPKEGIELYEVLSSVKKTHSKLLNRELYAYWDSVASVDRDSAKQYFQFLTDEKMLHHPTTPLTVEEVDNVNERRVWSSGVDYQELFTSKLVIKLSPGEFVLMNNLTWAHSANNWTPNSGVRKVSAAFA